MCFKIVKITKKFAPTKWYLQNQEDLSPSLLLTQFFIFAFSLVGLINLAMTIQRLSKQDVSFKTWWKWRKNGVIFPFMVGSTTYLRHFDGVFDDTSCFPNLSIIVGSTTQYIAMEIIVAVWKQLSNTIIRQSWQKIMSTTYFNFSTWNKSGNLMFTIAFATRGLRLFYWLNDTNSWNVLRYL